MYNIYILTFGECLNLAICRILIIKRATVNAHPEVYGD